MTVSNEKVNEALEIIKEMKAITATQMAEKLGYTKSPTYCVLKELRNRYPDNVVKVFGPGGSRDTHYEWIDTEKKDSEPIVAEAIVQIKPGEVDVEAINPGDIVETDSPRTNDIDLFLVVDKSPESMIFYGFRVYTQPTFTRPSIVYLTKDYAIDVNRFISRHAKNFVDGNARHFAAVSEAQLYSILKLMTQRYSFAREREVEVVKEVPVEKEVIKEVVKEVPAHDPDYEEVKKALRASLDRTVFLDDELTETSTELSLVTRERDIYKDLVFRVLGI